MEPRILRTQTGYQLGNLEATGITPRESQALLLRASGFNVDECAKAMGCGKANVQDRISNLFYKCGASSTPELITKAFQSGILRFLSVLLLIQLAIAPPDNAARFTRTKLTRSPSRNEQRLS
jgi:DNA-binding CsgD family transcriptional regulator